MIGESIIILTEVRGEEIGEGHQFSRDEVFEVQQFLVEHRSDQGFLKYIFDLSKTGFHVSPPKTERQKYMYALDYADMLEGSGVMKKGKRIITQALLRKDAGNYTIVPIQS